MTSLFWLLYNSEITVTLLIVPDPHDTTASMLVLLQGGGLGTNVPLVNVETNVSEMELYKSHRVNVHLLAVGAARGVFVGILVGDFVGVNVVGGLIGCVVGENVGAVVGILVGCLVGIVVGAKDGERVGTLVGTLVGRFVGIFDGTG